MKKAITFLLLLLPLLSMAQGIKFEEGLTWEQVKQKAKAENKFIFVDCYATWCRPCREMDIKVYPLENVGDYFNDKFISVKMQMDTSKLDNENIVKQYYQAKYINETYNILAYPTFLFFSQEGTLIHRAVGGFDAKRFISLGADALNPEKQYYTLLNNYNAGKRDTAEMKLLASAANSFGDKELAKQIIKNYVSYLTAKDKSNMDVIRNVYYFDSEIGVRMVKDLITSLPKDKLYSEENLQFMREFPKVPEVQKIVETYINALHGDKMFTKNNMWLIQSFTNSTKDRGFKICYNNIDRINKVMNDERWVQSWIVYRLILDEEVWPYVAKSKKTGIEPNWEKITSLIKSKYRSTYASLLVGEGKLSWFAFKKDWERYSGQIIKKVEAHVKKDDLNTLNGNAWTIFQYSNKESELKKAASWLEPLLVKDENSKDLFSLDTYANLKYKLGKVSEAIEFEIRAFEASLKVEGSIDGFYTKQIYQCLDKMKAGLPTWPVLEKNKNQ